MVEWFSTNKTKCLVLEQIWNFFHIRIILDKQIMVPKIP